MWRVAKIKHLPLYNIVDGMGNHLKGPLSFRQVVDYCMEKRDNWALNSLTFLLAISDHTLDIQKYKE